MILECIDILSTWLQDGTNGVNALLAGVPRLGSDPQPANVTVLDERTNGNAARGELPQDQADPVLLVGVHADARYVVPFDQSVRDASEVLVSLEYARRNATSEAALRDGLYTLVAVERSLRLLWTVGTPANRKRGTVSLVYPTSLTQGKPWAPVGDVIVTHQLSAGYYVRDTSP